MVLQNPRGSGCIDPCETIVKHLSISLALTLVLAAAPVAAQSIGDHITKGGSLGEQYSDFNQRLMQIQTVKSLPFFNKTPQQRASAVRGYYQSVRTGDVRGFGSSVKADFSNGGIAKDVGIALMTQVLTQVSQGKSMDEAVSKTVRYMMTPEYLIGNLMGGIAGAALGSMIPIPGVGGFLGQLIGGVPTMTGAMLGSNLGSKIVHGIRNGNLDMGEIVKSIDWISLGFQSVGATAGMIAGSALPVPFLGQLVGGVVGGQLGSTAAKWVKGKLNIGQPDQDWISTPDFDGVEPIDWRDIPPWMRDAGANVAGAGMGAVGSIGLGASTGTVAAGRTLPPRSASFAPAAPVTTGSLDEKASDALRRYTEAERAGDKAKAATAYAEYQALKARLDQLRSAGLRGLAPVAE